MGFMTLNMYFDTIGGALWRKMLQKQQRRTTTVKSYTAPLKALVIHEIIVTDCVI